MTTQIINDWERYSGTLVLAQSINHLRGFAQAAAVELAGGVHGGDVLAAGGQFGELLLLVFTAQRLHFREVVLHRNCLSNDRIGTQKVEELASVRHHVPMNAK